MPNWVNNTLTVKFPTEKEAKQFIKKYFTDGEFDFDKVIPQPTKIEECPTDCLVNENSHIQLDDNRPWFDWYKWNTKNWGTKWNACEVTHTLEKSHFNIMKLTIVFDTAWSFPVHVIHRLFELEKFTRMRFDFEYEDGYYGHLENNFHKN